MYKRPWEGNQISTEHRILILGESHYKDEESGKMDFTTASVVDWYLKNYVTKGRFFDQIAESFGYFTEEKEKFWQKVFFGNYVEVICGIRDSRAKTAIEENRKKYNDSLFQYINEHEIDTVVCFSKLTYHNLPGLTKRSEKVTWQSIGTIGAVGRKNYADKCNYEAGLEHKYCSVILERPLTVYAFRHPSARCGYDAGQVYQYLKEKPEVESTISK